MPLFSQALYEDVAKMVRFCKEYEIKVAPQGARHTTYGQAIVENGFAIDITYFRTISIGTDSARVGAGVLWRDFIREAASQGVQPASFHFTSLPCKGVGRSLSIPAYARQSESGRKSFSHRCVR